MRQLKRKEERGYVLVMVAAGIIMIMGFGALSVDLGFLYHKRGQLQKSADLGALAGATGLISYVDDLAMVRSVALRYARANLQDNDSRESAVVDDDVVFLRDGTATTTDPNQVEVTTNRAQDHGNPVALFLGPVMGVDQSDVRATARAQVFNACTSDADCILPVSIPDKFTWNDTCEPRYANNEQMDWNSECERASIQVIGYSQADMGTRITIKMGDPHIALAPSQFAPIQLPPENKGFPQPGAATFRARIQDTCYGDSGITLEPGDLLRTQTGNMMGPARQGFNYLINQDRGAYWDDATNSIRGSSYPDPMASPRVKIMPFYDPLSAYSTPGHSGPPLVVNQLGAIFIEGVDNQGNVTARFINAIAKEPNPQTGEDCLLRSVALVRDSSR
jgi:hypothetical protein